MAEAGSFAEKVKQQADIVRVIGEYVRLKKTGQNFTAVPVSSGKDAVVQRAPGEADVSLLWLRRGRRRFQIRDGDGKVRRSRRRCEPSRKNAASRFRGRGSVRPRSGAKISSAPRWWKCTARRRRFLRGSCTKAPEGKVASRVSAKIAAWIARRCAIRIGLCAIGRRSAAAPSEAEIFRRSCSKSPAFSAAIRAGAFTTASAAGSCSRSRTKPGKSSRSAGARWATTCRNI